MKPKTKFPLYVLFLFLLASLLAACGSRPRINAPEIDPPSDLIPAYVPEGYELVAGFQIEVGDISGRFMATGDDGRILCGADLVIPFFQIKSPAGNDLIGVYYEDDDDGLLLITRSAYPGGSLEGWQAAYDEAYADSCDCDCDCLEIALDIPIPLREAELRELTTVGETPAAVLEGPMGMSVIFMRGDDLIAVEGDLPLEDLLRIVESLLQ